jgi:peptidyl-prolyl cis-trans isomerase SurA
MQPNQIAGPVRSSSGYHILGLREKRTIMMGGEAKDIKLNVQQAFRPFDDTTNQDSVLEEAARLRSSVTTCTNLQATLTEKFPGWKWNNVGDLALDKAPEPIGQKVRDLSIGQASEAIATDKGALVLFVCDRKVPEGNINREAIVAAIGTEKLELQARRLLRDLRRTAYLDLRMKNSPSL